MSPCIPFFINNYQFVFLSTIFLLLHMLCALLGASCFQFSVLFSLVLFAGHNKLGPSMPCFGERHAPLLPRMLMFSLLSFECSLFSFQLLLFMFSSYFSCLFLSKSCYQNFQNSLEFHAYLFTELAFVALVVSYFEQVIQIAKLSLVITCNSFEVLIQVMFELLCD